MPEATQGWVEIGVLLRVLTFDSPPFRPGLRRAEALCINLFARSGVFTTGIKPSIFLSINRSRTINRSNQPVESIPLLVLRSKVNLGLPTMARDPGRQIQQPQSSRRRRPMPQLRHRHRLLALEQLQPAIQVIRVSTAARLL